LCGGNDDIYAYSLLEAIYKREPQISEMVRLLKAEVKAEFSKPETWSKVQTIAQKLLEKRRVTLEECISYL
jgi:hypothetical protein